MNVFKALPIQEKNCSDPGHPRDSSLVRRLNPEDRINRNPEDQNNLKNDRQTKNAKNCKDEKNEYDFEPNIWPDFHLVNFDVLRKKLMIEALYFINQYGQKTKASCTEPPE